MSDQFDLFEGLNALHDKNYSYYDGLSDAEKKSCSIFMLVQWLSMVDSTSDINEYYLRAINENVNKYLFAPELKNHEHLAWLLLCTVSPDVGRIKVLWNKSLGSKFSNLKDKITSKDVDKFFKKTDIAGIVELHNRKVYLAKTYPNMKRADIEILAKLTTDGDIKQDEQARGN